MGVFSNIGNFGRKLSDLNEKRKEKQFEQLKNRAETAKVQEKKVQEELKLRKQIERSNLAKKKLQDQKKKDFEARINKFSFQGDRKDKKTPLKFEGGFKF